MREQNERAEEGGGAVEVSKMTNVQLINCVIVAFVAATSNTEPADFAYRTELRDELLRRLEPVVSRTMCTAEVTGLWPFAAADPPAQGQPEVCKHCGLTLNEGFHRSETTGSQQRQGTPHLFEAAQPQMSAREFRNQHGFSANDIAKRWAGSQAYELAGEIETMMEAFARSRDGGKGNG